jgi:hypothetical protein
MGKIYECRLYIAKKSILLHECAYHNPNPRVHIILQNKIKRRSIFTVRGSKYPQDTRGDNDTHILHVHHLDDVQCTLVISHVDH